MHLPRVRVVIGACLLALLSSSRFSLSVDAQQNLPPPGGYIPIPNFTGDNAGLSFRNSINDRFAGVQPIAPRLGNVTFANLGPEQDGSQLYCTDCKATLPCSAGGSGAWATGTVGQWQCNAPMVPLKFDGTDSLSPFNGTRTNEKNILDFGAIASNTRINCSATAGSANITCTGVSGSDFAPNQNVALYGAGPAPSVAQPTGLTLQPTTTTNSPSSATRFTRFVQGCTVQNALAWCTAGSSSCLVGTVSFYEPGQTVTIAGAGAGGAALTTTISALNANFTTITLATAASTTVKGAAMTGANCTTSRRYQVFPIDSRGGWGPPTAVTTVNNTASALNWGNWVDVQVNVPQPPNAPNPNYPLPGNIPMAWAFYCAEGTAPLQLCGVEVPTYSSMFGSSDPAPWNDQLLGGNSKGFPTVVTFHDVGKPYGRDVIQSSNPPAGLVNAILTGRIVSISGTTVRLSASSSQSGSFTMGHDNGPNINAAIVAACGNNNQCGSVFTPFEPALFPVATPIVALRGVGLHLFGGAGPNFVEPFTPAPAGWLWVGALGGTMLQLNQQTKEQVENLSLQASAPGALGSTMGVSIDIDGFDPGDGLGNSVTATRPTLRDVYTGQASVGVRLANINGGNVEFGVLESSIINVVFGANFISSSNIGLLINSSNALGTRIDGSILGGNIGVWNNLGGFYAVESPMSQVDGIAVFLAGGVSHPITIETTRNENIARAVYCPDVGGATGTQLSLRGNTFIQTRVPSDGAFISLCGGQTTVLEGNEFFLTGAGFNGDFTTDQFPNGLVLPSTAGGIESRGNFWSSICGDPYALIASVNASGDVCYGNDGSAHHIAAYSRGDGGSLIGTPSGGAMGEGSLNLGGLLFHNGQPLVNWGEASVASIAASATASTTVNWNTAFGDSNYDFSCVVVDGAGFLSIWGASSKSAGSVAFQVKNNDTGAAHSGTANCIAVHH